MAASRLTWKSMNTGIVDGPEHTVYVTAAPVTANTQREPDPRASYTIPLDMPSEDKGNGAALEPLCQILTPVGMLSCGFDQQEQITALEKLKQASTPTALILDSGSTDSGPAKLATGVMSAPESAYERDLRKLLALVHKYHVPLIISSAGGDGSNQHVDCLVKIIKDIAAEPENSEYNFKTIAIYSDVSKSTVMSRFHAGEITPCGKTVPPLAEDDIVSCPQVCSQMGPEPFLDAMLAQPDFDIIIGGRAYDPSPYIAYALFLISKTVKISMKTVDRGMLGGFTHMGKIMECGALCATPKSASALATIYRDGTFDICPLAETAKCLPSSVAAHTLYEKSRPDLLAGPGGVLDLRDTTYEQLTDGRSVRARGARFIPHTDDEKPYTVKLEAAKLVGFRSLVMGGFRDPILISQLDGLLELIKKYVASQISVPSDQWKLIFHTYGKNGILGALEPGEADYVSREVFLVAEAVAEDQRLANDIASLTKVACAHGSYPGQKATSGNFAFGVGGNAVVEMGAVAEFCIYHLMELTTREEHAFEVDETGNCIGEGQAPEYLYTWRQMRIGKGEKSLVANGNGITATQSSRHKPRGVTAPPTLDSPLPNLHDPHTLADICPIIRSKNSGPYELTLDVLLSSKVVYEIVKNADPPMLGRSMLAEMFHLDDEEVIWSGFFDPAMAWKGTVPRKRNGGYGAAGGVGETDCHGVAAGVGLLDLRLRKEVRDAVRDAVRQGNI